jgi:Domain of unknown function (DUF4157)
MVERRRKDVEHREVDAERGGAAPAGDAGALLRDSQAGAGNQATTRLARALAARRPSPAGGAGGGRGLVADLSAVQVRQAPEAESMGALAFSRGAEIHFAPGAFDPTNSQGMEQLGHELAHVVQQRAGRVAGAGADAELEPEADALGGAATRG